MLYYSEKLDQKFKTEDELKKAEAEKEEADRKSAIAKVEKKADAGEVEAAFKAFNSAKRDYNDELVRIRKEYADKVRSARNEFESKLDSACKEKDEAKQTYKAALDKFISKHPEGYHLTLRDGDDVLTLSDSYDESRKALESAEREFDRLWDRLFDAFRLF